MAISHRVKPRYATKNEEIIAKLRAEVGAGPPRDPVMVVKKLAAEIAIQMALHHGGDWRVRVDHQEGLVIVARRGHRQTL